MLSFMDPPSQIHSAPEHSLNSSAAADGVRLIFSLNKDPDANVFNVRQQLAPPKPPKRPVIPEKAPEPSPSAAVEHPAPEPSGAEPPGDKPEGEGDATPRDGNPLQQAEAEDAAIESGEDVGGALEDAPEASLPKKRGRAKKMDEEDFYDVHDPFIDDSDLQELVGSVIIEPKVTGYFMWRGSVETVHVQVGSADSPKKRGPAKKRKTPAGSAVPGPAGKKAKTGDGPESSANVTDAAPKKRRKKADMAGGAGTDSALAVKTDLPGTSNTPQPGMSPARTTNGPSAISTPKPLGDMSPGEAAKPKITEQTPLHPSLIDPLEELRLFASNETWENKQKFPISLKPLLLETARKAVDVSPEENLDVNFLYQLALILPYNKVTLRNLIQRHLLPERIEQKKSQLEAAYILAREKIAKQTIPITDTKQEPGSPVSTGPSLGSKISWNKDLRGALYNIYELELAISKAEDQLRVVNKQEPTFDESKVKTQYYDNIFALFPEGLIKRDAVSRNFFLHKQQLQKKEAMATDA